MIWEADTMMQVQICGFLWTCKLERAFSFKGFFAPWPHRAVFGQFVCYFLVTVINIYWSMDAAIVWCIYVVNNCCLSLYSNIAGVSQCPGKMLQGSWKSPGTFCYQESGNPDTGQFWGLSGPLKSIGSQCCDTLPRTKLMSGTAALQLTACNAALHCPREKFCPLQCSFWSKFLDYLFIIPLRARWWYTVEICKFPFSIGKERIFRSTLPSRPNKVGLKCPSAHRKISMKFGM